jgi:hypothetical protein
MDVLLRGKAPRVGAAGAAAGVVAETGAPQPVE